MRKLLFVTIALAVAAIGCSKKDGGGGNSDPYSGYHDGYNDRYNNNFNNCPGFNGNNGLPNPYQFNSQGVCVDLRKRTPVPANQRYLCSNGNNWTSGFNNVGWNSGFRPACNFNSTNGAYNFNYYYTGICQELTRYNPGKVYIEMRVPGGMVSCVEYAAYTSYIPANFYGSINPAVPINACVYGNCGCRAGASISLGVFPFFGFNYGFCAE